LIRLRHSCGDVLLVFSKIGEDINKLCKNETFKTKQKTWACHLVQKFNKLLIWWGRQTRGDKPLKQFRKSFLNLYFSSKRRQNYDSLKILIPKMAVFIGKTAILSMNNSWKFVYCRSEAPTSIAQFQHTNVLHCSLLWQHNITIFAFVHFRLVKGKRHICDIPSGHILPKPIGSYKQEGKTNLIKWRSWLWNKMKKHIFKCRTFHQFWK